MNNIDTEQYWQSRYQRGQTEWDMGQISPPIKHYIDTQLRQADRNLAILVAGAGNGHEAHYLHALGFTQVIVVDFAQQALDNFAKNVPAFNKKHLLKADFFELDATKYQFDLSIEQTFFGAITPSKRPAFVQKTHSLLKPGGRLIGLLWNCEFDGDHPPYGGDESTYRQLFEQHFELTILADCNNSHPKRQKRELFIDFVKKS